MPSIVFQVYRNKKIIFIINGFACQLRVVEIRQYNFKTLFLGESSSMAVRIIYFNLLKLLHIYHMGKLHISLGRLGEGSISHALSRTMLVHQKCWECHCEKVLENILKIPEINLRIPEITL